MSTEVVAALGWVVARGLCYKVPGGVPGSYLNIAFSIEAPLDAFPLEQLPLIVCLAKSPLPLRGLAYDPKALDVACYWHEASVPYLRKRLELGI